jgi:glycosyltransferase involved in cell wall biosynthesis
MSKPFNLVVNPLSFGQISTGILRELYKRNADIVLSLHENQFEPSSEERDEEFFQWISTAVSLFHEKHDRDNRVFSLWHLNGALKSVSKEQVLLAFYELDSPTNAEINVVKNNFKTLFSNQEAVDAFKEAGCENVEYIPLAFDDHNFKKTDINYDDDRIVFSVLGKYEKRKNHEKAIKAWIKKYGDNKKYALHCAIWNPFLSPEDNNGIAASLMGNRKVFNVLYSGFMSSNKQYNEFLNSAHVVLGVSGGEGWGLPEFQSVALGKHAVILNCSGYKGWATDENSVLLEPSGKQSCVDGIFFHEDAPWNRGQIYDFDEDAFISSCEEVIKRVEKDRNNKAGEKLKENFTYSRMVDSILKHLE